MKNRPSNDRFSRGLYLETRSTDRCTGLEYHVQFREGPSWLSKHSDRESAAVSNTTVSDIGENRANL